MSKPMICCGHGKDRESERKRAPGIVAATLRQSIAVELGRELKEAEKELRITLVEWWVTRYSK